MKDTIHTTIMKTSKFNPCLLWTEPAEQSSETENSLFPLTIFICFYLFTFLEIPN